MGAAASETQAEEGLAGRAPSPEQVRLVAEFRPALLARAVALLRGDVVEAEDLVQEILLGWWEGPSRRRTALQLKHFLRTVMKTTVIKRYHGGWFGAENQTFAGVRELQFETVEDDW